MWRRAREKFGLVCSCAMACSAGGCQYVSAAVQAARGTAGQRVNTGTGNGDGNAPCLFWRGSRLASSSLESVGMSAAMVTTGQQREPGTEEGVAGLRC